jgi:hypothetical protein
MTARLVFKPENSRFGFRREGVVKGWVQCCSTYPPEKRVLFCLVL